MVKANIKKTRLSVLLTLTVLWATVTLLGTGIGAVNISPRETICIILHRFPGFGRLVPAIWEESHETIIWGIRFPRVLLAGQVGFALAVSGATFQGIFSNPMAEPYVIGASSGASLGAAIAIVLSVKLPWFPESTIPIFAFISSISTLMLVYNLARTGGKVPILTLLLSGIAVSTFLSAIVSLFIYFSGDKLHRLIYWLMGSFTTAGWNEVIFNLPYILMGFSVILIFARDLNIMLFGEETALHLGVPIEKVKILLLASASLLTAAAVAVSGVIGFVGLVIPHIVRLAAGPDHKLLIPASGMAGAAYLIFADTLARTVIAPTEIPVGVITALFGGPFFIYLLKRKKHGSI